MSIKAKEAEAEGENDGFTRVPNDRTGRRRAAREGAMIDDSIERLPAGKKAGQELEDELTRTNTERVAAQAGNSETLPKQGKGTTQVNDVATK